MTNMSNISLFTTVSTRIKLYPERVGEIGTVETKRETELMGFF